MDVMDGFSHVTGIVNGHLWPTVHVIMILFLDSRSTYGDTTTWPQPLTCSSFTPTWLFLNDAVGEFILSHFSILFYLRKVESYILYTVFGNIVYLYELLLYKHTASKFLIFHCMWVCLCVREVKKLECRYTTGLARLEEAETSVLAMQQELLNLQPILLTKTREVEDKMAVVEKRRQEVAEVRGKGFFLFHKCRVCSIAVH